MPATKGKDGGVYVGGSLVTFCGEWSLTRGRAMEDTAGFGDDWEKPVPTIKNWSASISFLLDRSDAQQAALLDQLEDAAQATQVVRLATERGSDYYEGSAYWETDQIQSSLKGLVKVSGTLRGYGELTWTEA